MRTSADVDALFRTKLIEEVRQVEAETQRQIEEKKQQLRTVVGDSYRDLISSADTIINISRSCHRVVDVVAGLQQGLADVSASIHQRRQSMANEQAASSYEHLYTLGSRVKFLVDSPEAIYGCLDAGDYLAAARRFALCELVHKSLASSQNTRQTARRFPLLQHQWPLVRKLRGQIRERTVQWLSGQGRMSAVEAAAALLALALLQPMEGTEVLKVYLSSRLAYLKQCLAQLGSQQAGTAASSLASSLSELAAQLCTAVAHCGELFLALPGVAPAPLLMRLVHQQLHSGELALQRGSAEAEVWATQQQAVQARLAELSAAGVALECRGWLDSVAQQLRQAEPGLLGSCASCADLQAVEAAVTSALGAWQHTVSSQSDGQPTTAPAAAGAAPAAEAALRGASSRLSADGSAQLQQDGTTLAVLQWSDVSQWVMAQPCGLWQLLFEEPLLQRARQLVGASFQAVVVEVSAAVDAALGAAGALPPCDPGYFRTGTWSAHALALPGDGDWRPGSAEQGTGKQPQQLERGSGSWQLGGSAAGSSAAAAAAAAACPWACVSQQAEHVLQLFDQQLASALTAAQEACYGQQQEAEEQQQLGGRALAAQHARSSAAPAGSSSSAASARAPVLEPFAREQCTRALGSVAELVESKVQGLLALTQQPGSAAAAAAAAAPAAHQALLLGRVALGVAGRSLQLGAPDERWLLAGRAAHQSAAHPKQLTGLYSQPALAAGGNSSGSRLAVLAVSSPELERLQQQLHDLGSSAYAFWAGWAAPAIAAALVQGWAADQAVRADACLRAWEETTISAAAAAEAGEEDAAEGGGDGQGAGSGEMRFWLPVAASPAALEAALAACQEADRVGGHDSNDLALQLLKQQLGAAVVLATRAALQPGGVPQLQLSERGTLQLLFDLRFLRALLAGSSQPTGPRALKGSAGGPAAAAAAAHAGGAFWREAEALEEELSGRLDPIDWATYESHLNANCQRFVCRCQVLVGLLARPETQQQQPDGSPQPMAPPPATTSGDSNALCMAEVGARFSYLPVNSSAAARRTASGAAPVLGGGAALDSLPTAEEQLMHSAAAQCYSFAALGVVGSGGSSGAGGRAAAAGVQGEAGGVASTVGAAALEALGRAKVMGSLLGDRAATALAGESFESIQARLTPQGLLSSLNLPSFQRQQR